jgi:hypothetical protein
MTGGASQGGGPEFKPQYHKKKKKKKFRVRVGDMTQVVERLLGKHEAKP